MIPKDESELSAPFLPGVSKIDLTSIEKTFRGKRLLSQNMRKGANCKIDKMRLVLKHWWTPRDISEKEMKKKNVDRYRSLVYAYLRDSETKKVPSGYKPIIEEYRDFVTTPPDKKVLKESVSKTKISKVKNQIKPTFEKSEIKPTLEVKNQIKPTLEKYEGVFEILKQFKLLGVKEFNIKF